MMRFTKHTLVHSIILGGSIALVLLFALILDITQYTGTFIFAGVILSTIYEIASRGSTLSKRKWSLNIVILIISFTLLVSTVHSTSIYGLNITPLIGGTPPGVTPPAPGGQLTITAIDAPAKVDKFVGFDVKITVKNIGQGKATQVCIKIESTSELAFGSAIVREQTIGTLEIGQSSTKTFQGMGVQDGTGKLTIRVTSYESGIAVAYVTIRVGTTTDDNGDDTKDKDEDELIYTTYPADSQNMFANMFTEVLNNTLMGITAIFIILGTILIIMGDAQDSKDMYSIGAFAACIPSALTIFSLFLGWAQPSQYFINLAGSQMAGFAQGIVTLIVLMLFLSIAFMFDDLIGSAME